MKKVRTRFAPSPTGALHIGGVRTALYNYLFAKQNGGEFILRIEDTDQKRYDEKAEQYIVDSFKWFGIEFDESPSNPVEEYGKYRQSERNYIDFIRELVGCGFAYYAFDTTEELDKAREDYKKQDQTFMYNYLSRQNMKNSITLSAEEVSKRMANNDPYTVRFKMPRNRDIIVEDLIRGKVKFNTNTLDDKVLMKEDGTPTYHLANIVDDHLMEISHVIRGEEWLPSLPLHCLLYEAFDWEPPVFAHLNLILNPDGKGKLSKRSAIKKGFSVFPLTASCIVDEVEYVMEGYKEKGYEPDAVINFLALLGWSPSQENEIYSIKEMIDIFNLNKLSKAGSRFDLDKLDWFNSQYINKLSISDILSDEIYHGLYSPEKEKLIGELVKERATFRKDFDPILNIFYSPIESYTDKSKLTEDCKHVLDEFSDRIEDFDFSDKDGLKNIIYNIASNNDIKFGSVMPGLRQALTGGVPGPDLFTTMYILGKDETKKLIIQALNV